MKYISLLVVFLLAFTPMTYAAAGKEARDTGHLGNDQWHIRTDGDIEPHADSAYDIGQSGNEVAEIYVDTLYLGGQTLNGTGVRSIQFTASDFMTQTAAGGYQPVTVTTAPGIEKDNNCAAIVWADGETTPVQVTFKVPTDYASGGTFKLFCDESLSTTPNQVDFAVYVNKDGQKFDAATSNQVPVALAGTAGTPDMVTLSVGTDFTAIAAEDVISLNVWRDDTADGTGDLELYYAEFYYTAKTE